jgi:hypothetical protein
MKPVALDGHLAGHPASLVPVMQVTFLEETQPEKERSGRWRPQ